MLHYYYGFGSQTRVVDLALNPLIKLEFSNNNKTTSSCVGEVTVAFLRTTPHMAFHTLVAVCVSSGYAQVTRR